MDGVSARGKVNYIIQLNFTVIIDVEKLVLKESKNENQQVKI